jgi:folate-binding protein YgfZ
MVDAADSKSAACKGVLVQVRLGVPFLLNLDMSYCLLDRAFIQISGSDKVKFLQGIITNDINQLTPGNALYSLMLSPQGKFLFDFFIYDIDKDFVIDCTKSQKDDLITRLNFYKLRAKVIIEDVSEKYSVYYSDTGGLFKDNRHINMGYRSLYIKQQDELELGDEDCNLYIKDRINNVIPEGLDMDVSRSFPLEYKMDEIGAISFNKGCYVGQEPTNRIKFQGVIRKKIMKITAEKKDILQFGAEIIANNEQIGVVKSVYKNIALAMVRIQDLEDAIKNDFDIKSCGEVINF